MFLVLIPGKNCLVDSFGLKASILLEVCFSIYLVIGRLRSILYSLSSFYVVLSSMIFLSCTEEGLSSESEKGG